MAILSKALTLPLLFIFSLPVTIFAVFTTCLAVSVLLFRFTLIYIDLAVAVIPHYLLGGSTAPKFLHPVHTNGQHSLPSPPQPSYRRRKRRTSSSSSYSVAGSITPTLTQSMTDPQGILTSPSSYIGLNTSIGPSRDFEGVGGWRLDNQSEEEEGLWTKINSRLELPADHGRRHKRSLTSGSLPSSINPFGGALGMAEVKRGRKDEETPGMAMNTGRARTPPTTNLGGAGAGQEKDAFEKGVLMMSGAKGKANGNGGGGSSGSSKSSGSKGR
ncbi:hypothetical protein HYFRA_00007146 [Hymenoscyphus fraxineus]|uniref:Uncharacterized protein n=1 Tax=Hymenoscyphus fraxineus TaxID=746836 RepID=A0A9N9PPX4_9HELO|nr:hypothetical protein HYFRA_00007146 [Hymenoscyphus fraxineus]